MAMDRKTKYLGEMDRLGGDRPTLMRLMRSESVLRQIRKMHTQWAKRAKGRQEVAVDGHQLPDMEGRGEEAQEVEVETTEAEGLSRMWMWMKGQGPMMFLAQMVLVKLA